VNPAVSQFQEAKTLESSLDCSESQASGTSQLIPQACLDGIYLSDSSTAYQSSFIRLHEIAIYVCKPKHKLKSLFEMPISMASWNIEGASVG
jgi:hypothetical protein